MYLLQMAGALITVLFGVYMMKEIHVAVRRDGYPSSIWNYATALPPVAVGLAFLLGLPGELFPMHSGLLLPFQLVFIVLAAGTAFWAFWMVVNLVETRSGPKILPEWGISVIAGLWSVFVIVDALTR